MIDLTALEQDLSPEALEGLTAEQLQGLYEKVKPYLEYKRFHRLEWFTPYPYQRKFMNASKDYLIRYLRAGNRTGKTYGAAAEFAYHITGRYPDWWEGARISGAGHTFWAVGITLDSVATVMQKELFGTADIRTDELGTGTIPLECIERNQGWNPDGSRLKSCVIRHSSGQLNTLRFYGSENTAVMMGAKCALIWMDEEAFNGMDVYTQCKTRLINALGAGQNGYLLLTATPERGNTELNQLFDNDESGLLYIQSASWDDCPHFTPEQIEKELAGFPVWQHEMRRHGLPVIGTGAIFPYSDEQITVSEILPSPHWQALISLDWGVSHDPTVIIVALYNPDTDTYYIYDLIYLDKSDYDRSPAGVAEVLLNSPYKGLPIIRPHDHPALSQQLKNYGLDVQHIPAHNPPASLLKMKRVNPDSGNGQDVETGLDEMRYLFSEGRLKVLQRCNKWFEENRTYYYKLNKNTGKVTRTTPDHAIDASRYAIMALMSHRGTDWDKAAFLNNNDSFDAAPTLYL